MEVPLHIAARGAEMLIVGVTVGVIDMAIPPEVTVTGDAQLALEVSLQVTT